jgi:uncharacterized membrane protein
MGLIENAILRIKALDTRDYALIIVFSALMAITTMWAIPLPFGGLMHFGNIIMWTGSILFGGVIGGLGGGIGGMIVDIMEAPIWAIFTPFCKLASGLACAIVAGDSTEVNTTKIVRIVAATIVGWLINLLAYAPVYYLLLGPENTILWLTLFLVTPIPTIINWAIVPVVSLAILKAYPGISRNREMIKTRIQRLKEAKVKK